MKGLSNRTSTELRESPEWLGDLHPLLQQLGSTEGLLTLSSASATLKLERVETLAGLRRFLAAFRNRVLLPLELPVILRAHLHAGRNEWRELVELDQEVARRAVPPEFASASRRVGQSALRRLRPLRDERVVQRYLQAVEEGRAHGWHTVVYGMTTALYFLPLRQGLLNYARQTLLGFIHVASRPLELSEEVGAAMLEDLCAPLPQQVEKLLAAGAWSVERVDR
jgi:urease accessory protein UreF